MLPRLPSLKSNTSQKQKYGLSHVDLIRECLRNTEIIVQLQFENQNMSEELKKKIETISDLRVEIANAKRFDRSQQKVGETAAILARDKTIKELNEIIEKERKAVSDKLFKVDELKVEIIKYQRNLDVLSKENVELQHKTEQLMESGTTLGQENDQLQKRIRELIDANKDVTSNYQVVKKNFDLKKHECDELTLEVEEAKNACQLALKNVQAELAAALKAKAEVEEVLKVCEQNLSGKESYISELLQKLSDTVTDYEEKLERKEEQLWNMNNQLNEEVVKAEKQRVAASAAHRKQEEAAIRSTVDADLITDIEKKWQILSERIKEMEKEQFHPRMAFLKSIEKDMIQKLLEYQLSEEMLHTGFICPKSLNQLHVPVTLSPCGHTFCKRCVSDMKEENMNVLKCDVCNKIADAAFRNDQVESIIEQFNRHNVTAGKFNQWIKNLKDLNKEEYQDNQVNRDLSRRGTFRKESGSEERIAYVRRQSSIREDNHSILKLLDVESMKIPPLPEATM
ncbi:hypothetical protein HDV04_003492 [Boothiomyces sp. JEL0838]|nr:hypothetical protein HDV04_003492 [Boothiomyces sp. JEL0838]